MPASPASTVLANGAGKQRAARNDGVRAARRFLSVIEQGRQPVVFHLGDYDPSGIDMTRDIQDRLDLFTGDGVEVQRLALNHSC